MRRAAAALVLSVGIGSAVSAECRQALALGLDVSGSVDAREYRLQLDGLAGALSSDPVSEVLFAPGQPPVRIAVYEWSGQAAQRLLLDWLALDSPTARDFAAARLRSTERRMMDNQTGLGPALLFGEDLLDRAGPCLQRTLDISGDGRANQGPAPRDIRLARDITVNGLVIGVDTPATGDLRQMQVGEIAAYFAAEVIRGPDAFVETALGFQDFEAAMTRKLVRELEVIMLGRVTDP